MDRRSFESIEIRLGVANARRRLAIENRREHQLTPRKMREWNSRVLRAGFIRNALWWTGLYGRGRRNADAVILRRNSIKLRALPPAFEGFTILQLSDLHADTSGGAMRALPELMHGLAYDICVLTGDYRGRSHGPTDAALRAVANLREGLTAPAYAVLGNHDSLDIAAGLEAMGVRVLLNESDAVARAGQQLWIAGIDDSHYFRTGDIVRAAAQIPPDGFSILLSHTPEVYQQAAQAGFKLLLAGHTHGGQICLPGSIPLILASRRMPRRFGAGAWEYGGMTGYTSTGVGTSIIPVRFNCPPEITVHELHCA